MIKDLQHQFAHNKSTYPDQLNLRLHRALSWLQKSQETLDGCQILLTIIPAIIQIILDNPNLSLGKPFYPVVE